MDHNLGRLAKSINRLEMMSARIADHASVSQQNAATQNGLHPSSSSCVQTSADDCFLNPDPTADTLAHWALDAFMHAVPQEGRHLLPPALQVRFPPPATAAK